MRDYISDSGYSSNNVSTIQYLNEYKYEPNWDASYYSLDTREYFDSKENYGSYLINTYTSIDQNYQGYQEDAGVDVTPKYSMRPKIVEDWNAQDIMSWLIEIYEKEGFSYEPVNMHLLRNYNGCDLLKLQESKFYEIDETKAKWLYQKVRELVIKAESPNLYYPKVTYPNFRTTDGNFSSGSDCETEPIKQKKRGRPRSLNKIRRKSEHKTGKLWEFLRDLLLNPEYCPSLICWENHDEGIFRFVCSDKVAKIWGSKRGNSEMNYEKLSRAMRYYYKNKVLLPVLGKRLVYKFGPNAVGWRTNNPNFAN